MAWHVFSYLSHDLALASRRAGVGRVEGQCAIFGQGVTQQSAFYAAGHGQVIGSGRIQVAFRIHRNPVVLDVYFGIDRFAGLVRQADGLAVNHRLRVDGLGKLKPECRKVRDGVVVPSVRNGSRQFKSGTFGLAQKRAGCCRCCLEFDSVRGQGHWCAANLKSLCGQGVAGSRCKRLVRLCRKPHLVFISEHHVCEGNLVPGGIPQDQRVRNVGQRCVDGLVETQEDRCCCGNGGRDTGLIAARGRTVSRIGKCQRSGCRSPGNGLLVAAIPAACECCGDNQCNSGFFHAVPLQNLSVIEPLNT